MYCTQQDMIIEFGERELIQLTDTDGIGVLNFAVLNNAIRMGAAQIDGYISKFLPLTAVPDHINYKNRYLAWYDLSKFSMNDKMLAGKSSIEKHLMAIGRGEMPLGNESNTSTDLSTGFTLIASDQVIFGNAQW